MSENIENYRNFMLIKKEWKLDGMYQMVCNIRSWCFVLFVQWVKMLDSNLSV